MGMVWAAYSINTMFRIITAPVVSLPYDKLLLMSQGKSRGDEKKKLIPNVEMPLPQQHPLAGKIAIVTGSTNGLGE